MIIDKLSITDFVVLSIIAAVFGCVLALTKFRKLSTNILQYLVMGRNLTLPAFVVTLVSSWYGSIVGATQIAYKYGIYNFVVLGFFWYVSAFIFALFLASKFVKSEAISLPELVGKVQGKSSERVLMLLLVFKTLPIPYIMAFSMILTALFGWSEPIALILVLIIALIISVRSSLKSVMIVDFIQFLTIFIGMAFVLFFCMQKLGGLDYLVLNLPKEHLSLSGGNDTGKLFLWFLVALSTTVLSPIFHQRCFAARNTKVAKVGILLSICFWVVSDILTTVGGLYARAYLGEGHDNHAYLELMSYALPSGFKGYMIAAMLITAFSALDSYLFATKSLVVNYYRARGKTLSTREYILLGAFIAVVSTLFAANLDGDLEKAWLLFESAFIASLLFPVLASVSFKKSLSASQFNTIVIVTFVTVLISDYYYLSLKSTSSLSIMCINALVVGICMLVNSFRMADKSIN
jgi:SSS family solute:Na+ symporter